MAPSNKERGLPSETSLVVGTVAGFDRGTGNRSIPVPQSYAADDRYVTYRFEDTVRHASNSAYGKTYPYWAPVLVQKGNAAPERLVLGAGIVAFRAEPEWHEAPELPLSPPPLVAVPRRPPPPPSKKGNPTPQTPLPPPRNPISCPPGKRPTKSGLQCTETPETLAAILAATPDGPTRKERVEDAIDATLGDGFKNASKIAKWASLIPGPAGRVFKGVGTFFDAAHEAYEAAKLVKQLVAEMKQSEALEKGSKELLKRGEDAFEKAADRTLDKIVKKKGIVLPDSMRKQIIKQAREVFDKDVRDPLLDKGKKEFEKRMDPKERDRSLWEEWSRGLPSFR